MWGNRFYLLQNFSDAFTVKKENDLAKLQVNGTTRKSPWRQLFWQIPVADRLAESLCIQWKGPEDYFRKEQKVSLPPALPVDKGENSEEEGVE